MIDLVIFDCDGVLVDSEIIAARVEASLLTAAGFEITPEEIAETYSGMTFKDIMLRIEQIAGIPLQASLLTEAEALTDKRLAKEVRAIEGAREAVLSVTAPRCVCSNSTLERLDLMLTATNLKPLFGDNIFSSLATESKRPKPAPDVFLHAAKAMDATPAQTFVIEDSDPWHPRRQVGWHARDRLHRRRAQLSGPRRHADRGRRRNRHPPLGRPPGSAGCPGRMDRRRLKHAVSLVFRLRRPFVIANENTSLTVRRDRNHHIRVGEDELCRRLRVADGDLVLVQLGIDAARRPGSEPRGWAW